MDGSPAPEPGWLSGYTVPKCLSEVSLVYFLRHFSAMAHMVSACFPAVMHPPKARMEGERCCGRRRWGWWWYGSVCVGGSCSEGASTSQHQASPAWCQCFRVFLGLSAGHHCLGHDCNLIHTVQTWKPLRTDTLAG